MFVQYEHTYHIRQSTPSYIPVVVDVSVSYAGELTANRKRSVSRQLSSFKEIEASTRLPYELVNFVTHTGHTLT